MTLQIGERFAVKTAQDVRNAKGRLLARFRPEFTYGVTERNVATVREMEAAGHAMPAPGGVAAGQGDGIKLSVTPARVTGRATTSKKGQK